MHAALGLAAEGRMFDFFAIAIAVVALVIARKALEKASGLQSRLDALQASEWRLAPSPPPLAPAEPSAPDEAATSESAATAAPAEPATPPLHEAPPSVPDDAAADTPRPTPAAPPPHQTDPAQTAPQ